MGFFSGFNINMLIHQQQTNSKQEQAESSQNHPKQANQPEPTPNLPFLGMLGREKIVR